MQVVWIFLLSPTRSVVSLVWAMLDMHLIWIWLNQIIWWGFIFHTLLSRDLSRFDLLDLIRSQVDSHPRWKNDGPNLDGDTENAIWERPLLDWSDNIKTYKQKQWLIRVAKIEKSTLKSSTYCITVTYVL